MVPCVDAMRVTAVEEYELNGHTYGVPHSLPFHCSPCLYRKDVRKGSSGCRDGSGGDSARPQLHGVQQLDPVSLGGHHLPLS